MRLERTPGSAILVVDDEPGIVSSLEMMLQYWGYRAATAADGVAALELYEPGRFEVVVTDLMMPRMGGLELAQVIRQRAPEQRIVLMTGNAGLVAQAAQGAPNVDAILVKPFSADELHAKIGGASPDRERAE